MGCLLDSLDISVFLFFSLGFSMGFARFSTLFLVLAV